MGEGGRTRKGQTLRDGETDRLSYRESSRVGSKGISRHIPIKNRQTDGRLVCYWSFLLDSLLIIV